MNQDINDQDKLMAALAWLIPIVVPARILMNEESKSQPFQKYHAVHSLVFHAAVLLFSLVMALATAWIGGYGGYLGILLLVGAYYCAFKAYRGEYFEIPIITHFTKRQGWT